MAVGIILGVAAAVARMSSNPVLRGTAVFYAWLFRGTPVVLQLLLWFNLALIFPNLGIPGLWTGRAVVLITPFAAALLGLGLNEGAYVSEIVRAGLISVDVGQYEAAKSIGMSGSVALRRIILPQAMRVVVPPLGNQFISMVKTTSLASVIEYAELLHNAENIYYANAKVMELLFIAGLLVPGRGHRTSPSARPGWSVGSPAGLPVRDEPARRRCPQGRQIVRPQCKPWRM